MNKQILTTINDHTEDMMHVFNHNEMIEFVIELLEEFYDMTIDTTLAEKLYKDSLQLD